MDERTKYRIATFALAVGLGLAVVGYSQVRSEAPGGHVSGGSFVLLFGGAIMGIAAVLCRYYLKSRLNRPLNQAKIDTEILAALGKEKIERSKKE